MKLRITVIDDEECIRDTFKWHLEAQGHEVFTASEPMLCDIYQGNCCSSESACTDVLLIDYNMPRMTGLEFIEMMSQRGCKSPPATKIIMSGNTGDIDVERVKRLGCQVVQKPFSFAELDRIILQIIEKIKLEDASA
jgi:CheY-like chemotaxis protein